MARYVLLSYAFRSTTECYVPLLDLSDFDLAVISLCYQLASYLMVRLARRGFTLGELGAVSQGATAMFMETVNLTVFHVSSTLST